MGCKRTNKIIENLKVELYETTQIKILQDHNSYNICPAFFNKKLFNLYYFQILLFRIKANYCQSIQDCLVDAWNYSKIFGF